MSANVKHINYTTFENLSTVYEFMDIVESNTKSVEVSKIIRLTEDEILDLIEEFYGLSELLDVEEQLFLCPNLSFKALFDDMRGFEAQGDKLYL